MDEEAHRRQAGHAVYAIVFHPDHGHEFLSDIGRGTYSGYPLIGSIRVTRGLSELRGIVHALEHLQNT